LIKELCLPPANHRGKAFIKWIKGEITMDDLFAIIGRLYVDVSQAQKILENFQQKIKEKDQEIQELKKKLSKDSSYNNDDSEQ